jgi:cell division cycle protein 20 (cofactor of APC complex)
MTCAVVEYENLLAKTFSDQNTARPNSGALPRWKRKQMQSINSVRKKGIHSSNGKVHPERSNIKDLNLKSSSSDSSGEFCKPLGILNGRLRSNITGGDRFIPNRAAMDLEKSSHSIRVTESSCDLQGKSRNDDGQILVIANRNEEYKSILSSEILGIDDSQWKVCAPQHRILSFKEKAPLPKCDTVNNLNILYSSSGTLFKSSKAAKLVSRQIPSAPSRVLDAPDLLVDYYLNLLSWSDINILAVALV